MILPRSKTKIGIDALMVCANETGTFEMEKWDAAREKNFPNDKGRIVHFSVLKSDHLEVKNDATYVLRKRNRW